MMKSRFKGRGAVAAITAGVLLCAVTAQASEVELSLAERGAVTEHAGLPVSAPEVSAPDAQLWPILVAVAVALATMDRDLTSDLPQPQYDDAAFD
jgi:hypothetical protein